MADHFVIDGSNLATEGRTEPSLAQLRAGVNAFREEHPGAVTTVVVDASFEHRIDPSEREAFSKIESEGHVVSPPAGAVGRGDGFLLQIANRTGGTVISNDSFQEFHAEYEWLFEPGRLIGAKPVPGVGWIFSLRRPVRGIVSRKTVQKAKQASKEPKETKAEQKVRKAIAEATEDAMEPDAPKRRRRRGGHGRGTTSTSTAPEPEAVNDPAPFLQFVIDHRLGTEAEGTVDSFASHGAFVIVDGVRCYVPLSALGNPPPTRARDVLTRGEQRTFVIQAVDAPRRGIELGLPGFATVAGAPSDETVAAELRRGKSSRSGKASRDKTPAKTSKTGPKKSTPAKSTPQKASEGADGRSRAPGEAHCRRTRGEEGGGCPGSGKEDQPGQGCEEDPREADRPGQGRRQEVGREEDGCEKGDGQEESAQEGGREVCNQEDRGETSRREEGARQDHRQEATAKAPSKKAAPKKTPAKKTTRRR